MHSKTTGIWLVIAAALLAFIFVFEHYFRPAPGGPAPLLPRLRPPTITNVQVFPVGALEICADRTNGNWLLTQPVSYPAQSAAIEALLEKLQRLAPAKISAAELREHKNAEAEFGLENPQTTLVIAAADQSWQLKVGKKTAPGDQVYMRVLGVDGVFVADADWLRFVPRSVDEWRDTALVNAGQNDCDWIVLTNNVKNVVIELRREPTNHLWRIIRPLPARGDAERITDASQRLAGASVTRFVTSDPKADLAAFGLQPADLDLCLGHGTNLFAAVHVGSSPANDAAQVYARRGGWNTVLTTAREAFAPWRGAVNDFRDSRLIELTAPVAEIEVRGDNQYLLRAQGTNDWSVVGEKFPGDAANAQLFVQLLAGLRIAEFVKDVVTPPDLSACGLAAPRREIILRSRAGDTNAIIAQLDFGTNQDDKIFVQCAGEGSVYAIKTQDFSRLPEAGWEFRDRRIWDFKVDDVMQVTIQQRGKTRRLVHDAPGKWSLGPGSEGLIESKSIEQSVQQFHQLAAVGWVARNFAEPEKYGFNTNNLQIAFELKNGEKNTVDFGGEFAQQQSALAAVTLDGERWAFVFPPVLYQFVLSYLTIPATVP
jgi:hypothetical protein